jgi:poly-gamma-glutamate capsule biosynthesis protein CapA/YwtB (metallophosphatase superfamily)
MKIALTGDVMLGRLVDRCVIQDPSFQPAAVWGDVLPVLLAADLRLSNLECVIATRGQPWEPATKAFHFRASPRAIDMLRAAHIDCVTLANNHALDYGEEALLECLALLHQAGIRHAGAGLTLADALCPALLACPEAHVAVIGLTDNEPAWEATERTPGINYIAYDAQGLEAPYRARLAEVIAHARRQAELVIVSAHVGPNWGQPSPAIRILAHQLLDMGADLYWGHSNHTPQGIEIHNQKAILYSSGDFVDDYAVDSIERNDLSFLFLLEFRKTGLASLSLYPVAIDDFTVRLARGAEVSFLKERMAERCASFGSALVFHDRVGTITV